MDKEEIKKEIVARLNKIGIFELLADFKKHLSSKSHFYLVGGFIRDVIRSMTEGIEYYSDDIDIVLDGGNLEEAVITVVGETNKALFGAFRWKLNDDLQIDLWKIEKTIRTKPKDNIPGVENYLNDLYLNIDHIMFDLDTNEIIDDGCIDGVRNEVIEIQFSGGGFIPSSMDLSRVISLKRRLGYEIGNKLAKIIKDRKDEVIGDIKEKAQKNGYSQDKTNELISIVENLK